MSDEANIGYKIVHCNKNIVQRTKFLYICQQQTIVISLRNARIALKNNEIWDQGKIGLLLFSEFPQMIFSDSYLEYVLSVRSVN